MSAFSHQSYLLALNKGNTAFPAKPGTRKFQKRTSMRSIRTALRSSLAMEVADALDASPIPEMFALKFEPRISVISSIAHAMNVDEVVAMRTASGRREVVVTKKRTITAEMRMAA